MAKSIGPHAQVPNFPFSLLDTHIDLSPLFCASFQSNLRPSTLVQVGITLPPGPSFSIA